VRSRRLANDAAALLRSALASLAAHHSAGAGAPALDDASVEALVGAATEALTSDPDDPTWRVAEQIARLREVDPDSVDLAADWLDALLRRRGTEPGSGSRR
jgi:hypothetical protein